MCIRILLLFFIFQSTICLSQQRKLVVQLNLPAAECEVPKVWNLRTTPKNDTTIQLLTHSTFSCSDTFLFDFKYSSVQLIVEIPEYDRFVLTLKDLVETDTIITKSITPKKTAKNLDEFTVTGIKRSLIVVDADKTSITVQDNPILTTSSVYDALIKIPGVLPLPGGGGFSVQGKGASVYFEGIPSTLAGDDLMNLLKSLPATSVEKIELITNPGASYDANMNGSIIDIISLSKSSSWISGTATWNMGINQRNKFLPSFLISGKQRKYSWQVQLGNSFFERNNRSTSERDITIFDSLIQLNGKRIDNSDANTLYFKPSITFRLNRVSSLTLIQSTYYSTSSRTNESVNTGFVNYSNIGSGKSSGFSNDWVVKYKTRLDTLRRSLEFTGSFVTNQFDRTTLGTQLNETNTIYNAIGNTGNSNRFMLKGDLELPFSKQHLFFRTGLKYQHFAIQNKGQYALNQLDVQTIISPNYLSELLFNYTESNSAAYAEGKWQWKKLTLGGGVRTEYFQLGRQINLDTTRNNAYLNVFPTGNLLFKITRDLNFVMSYSKRISIPNYAQFDPNLNGYYDSYTKSVGNTQLAPNFYHQSEAKITFFDYLELAVNHTFSPTLNLTDVRIDPVNGQLVSSLKTYSNIQEWSILGALPIPFGFFLKGMKFFDEPIDVDKLNFVYLYAQRQQTSLRDSNIVNTNKAFWNMGLYSQFILPWEIRMNVDYYYGTKGTYQIYAFTQPRSSLEFVFSRSFKDKKWKTSLSIEDVFNTMQMTGETAFKNIRLGNYSKDDTRIVWFKLSYSFGKYEKPGSDESVMPNAGGLQNKGGE